MFAALFVSVYGFFLEPALRLRVKKWTLRRDDWPKDRPIRIAVLTDIHAAEPFTSLNRLRKVVARTNAVGADLIVILGDLSSDHELTGRAIPVSETTKALAELKAPQGVYAVLGNHDWWMDLAAQRRRAGPVETGVALEKNGIRVLENDALELPNGLWLAGLGDQLAFRGPRGFSGVDDLPGTLQQIPEGAPVILLAHEPDIFPQVPSNVALTLCGHTHGGQVRMFGYSPMVPSKYGNRYAYGVVEEDGKHLVVSGGIGCSMIPVRFGVVPEITVVELSA